MEMERILVKKGILLTLGVILLFILLRPLAQDYLDLLQYNREIENLQIGSPEIRNLSDGEYQGSYQVYSIEADVRVYVESAEITRIDLSHQHERGYNAEEITDRVIEQQSLDVEAVSGATHSSKVILKAIDLALTEEQGQ